LAALAQTKGFPGSSVYSATKAAVRSFGRTWTAEVPVEQTRFNVLSPGPIQTPIFGKTGMSGGEIDAFEKLMAVSVPAKRMGLPEEMAKAVLFLASDDSSYVAGLDLFADGGFGQV
jgi:NAD(P)-dependent dehydrogenase (short-subunit alcohol dehydrogenase family)